MMDVRKKYPSMVACSYNKGVRGRILCSFEPHTIVPGNWNVGRIKKHKAFITFNRKFCKLNNILSMSYITKGVCTGNVLDELDVFKPYNEKIKGICIIGRQGHLEWQKREGSAYYLRKEFLNDILVEPYLVKHLYAPISWGGSYYQGRCEPCDPWGIAPLKTVSRYLFCFCPENTYHSLWSWGYLTERLQRCFKAKTIAIYIGCYNIEELVPKELFIDFRDFQNDYKRLAEYLIKFPKEKYIEMTERAYKWDKNCKIRLTEDLDNLLKIAISKVK